MTEVERLRRQLARHKRRVEILETSVEDQTRELYRAHQLLEEHAQMLERTVASRTAELRQALAEAEALGRAKTDFLARMSHELRTPLHGVLGTLELLRTSSLSHEQRSWVSTAVASGDHLRRVIGEILDFSKLSSSGIRLEALPTDLVGLCRDCVEGHRATARAKGVELRLSVLSDDVPVVFGDPVRLRQIIFNLLSNALKFTARGGVVVALEATADADRAHVCIAVSDSGIGMTEAVVDRLFQPFVQAESSISRRFGGTGLGLAIVREVVDAMGGTITVTSEPDRGSTFEVVLSLPVTAEAPPALEVHRVTDLSGHVIAVVDDQPVNRQVARGLLEGMGAEVVEAAGGEGIVALLQAHRPSVLLLDCHMPGVDGYAACRALREAGHTLPVVAVTADLSSDNQALTAQAGMDELLGKPFTVHQLSAAVARHLRLGRTATVAPVAEPVDATVFDRPALLASIGGNEALAERLIRSFVVSLDGLVGAVRAAWASQAPDRIAKAAHALKGSSAAIQAHRVEAAARALELAGNEGEVLPEGLAALEAALDELRSTLAATA